MKTLAPVSPRGSRRLSTSRRSPAALVALVALAVPAAVVAAGCSSSDSVTAGVETTTGVALANPCTDSLDSIYADPGTLPADKGGIIRCAFEKTIAKADLLAEAKADGYQGKDFTSGAKVYRVLYRTERGDAAATAGYSSAVVMLPDTPRAAKLPTWVVSHGSRGQAPNCAPSKDDPTAAYVKVDLEANTYPPVGAGYAIIAPDLAGYSNYAAAGNAPSAYAGAVDVAKSTLDAARALQKLVSPDALLGTDTVISGHSQGGHTALSALAEAEAYAPELTIKAVPTFAPLWLAQRTWGALFVLASQYPIATSPVPTAVSVWYHYSHAELLDGPGEGIKLFKPAAQPAIKTFFDSVCWSANYPVLEGAGKTAADLFDPTFQAAVEGAAALGSPCGGANKDLCQKWMDRYAADRPHLTGKAASVPILVNYGEKDTTIPPERVTCALDALKTDAADFTVCVEPNAEHGGPNGIPAYRADYVNDWVASLTLGAAAPAACQYDQTAITTNGAAAKCATPPPND